MSSSRVLAADNRQGDVELGSSLKQLHELNKLFTSSNDGIVQNFEGEQNEELGDGGRVLSRFLFFSSLDEQRGWYKRHLLKKLLYLGLGSLTGVLYFAGSLLTKQSQSHPDTMEYHMGGSAWVTALLLLSLCATSFFIYLYASVLQEKKRRTSERLESKTLRVVQKFPAVLVLGLYPSILIRCAAFFVALHRIIASMRESGLDFGANNVPHSLNLELASFWVYVFMGHGFLMCMADVPFHVIAPALALGVGTLFANAALCFRWDLELIASGTMLTGTTGLACAGMLFFFTKNNMQYYAISKKFDSALVRARRLAVDAVRQKVAAADRVTREKTLVFGQLAHDIGTPLAALSMAVELLWVPPSSSAAALRAPGTGEGTAAGAKAAAVAAAARSGASAAAAAAAEEQQRAEAFEAVRASVAAMVVLRQAMLDYVKKATGAVLKPSLEVISASEIVHSAYLVLKQLLARTQNVRPRYVLDPRLARARVVSSKSWLLDMLLNLVSNAVKFTAAGEICIRARYATDPATGRPCAVFEVRDTGRGVDPRAAPRLFGHFQQLQGDAGGTGLGLASVKHKATLLGGDAGFRNNADDPDFGGDGGPSGCTFFFRVPLEPPPPLEGGHGAAAAALAVHGGDGGGAPSLNSCRVTPSHRSTSGAAAPGSGRAAAAAAAAASVGARGGRGGGGAAPLPLRRVMIVDDSELLLKLYTRIIKKNKDVEVVVAENGKAALQAFQKNPGTIDLILMDDEMPPGDRGPEVAKKILKLCESLGVRYPSVFICSGGSRELLESDFPDIYRHVNDILVKPLSPSTIAQLLEHRCVMSGGTPGEGACGSGSGRRPPVPSSWEGSTLSSRALGSASARSWRGRGLGSHTPPLQATLEHSEHSANFPLQSHTFQSGEIDEARTFRGQLLANALYHQKKSNKDQQKNSRDQKSARGGRPRVGSRSSSSFFASSLKSSLHRSFGEQQQETADQLATEDCFERHGSSASLLDCVPKKSERQDQTHRDASAYLLPMPSPLGSIKQRMNCSTPLDLKMKAGVQQLPPLSAVAVPNGHHGGAGQDVSPPEKDLSNPTSIALNAARPELLVPVKIPSSQSTSLKQKEVIVREERRKTLSTIFSADIVSSARSSRAGSPTADDKQHAGKSKKAPYPHFAKSSSDVVIDKAPVLAGREPRNQFFFSEESSTLGDTTQSKSLALMATETEDEEGNKNDDSQTSNSEEKIRSSFNSSGTNDDKRQQQEISDGHKYATTSSKNTAVAKNDQNKNVYFYLDETIGCASDGTSNDVCSSISKKCIDDGLSCDCGSHGSSEKNLVVMICQEQPPLPQQLQQGVSVLHHHHHYDDDNGAAPPEEADGSVMRTTSVHSLHSLGSSSAPDDDDNLSSTPLIEEEKEEEKKSSMNLKNAAEPPFS